MSHTLVPLLVRNSEWAQKRKLYSEAIPWAGLRSPAGTPAALPHSFEGSQPQGQCRLKVCGGKFITSWEGRNF